MTDLIKKLRDATGPDRELDALVAIACGKIVPAVDAGFPDGISRCAGQVSVRIAPARFQAPAFYTASLDAALALAGEVLPDWAIGLNSRAGPEGLWRANTELGGESRNGGGFCYHKSPAIALLIAILQAQGETE